MVASAASRQPHAGGGGHSKDEGWRMDGTLRGAVAIITGAGSGIGAAAARTLAGDGCRTVLVGRRARLLDEQADLIRAAGGEALAVAGDVRDYRQVEAVVARALDTFRRLDILVANAAIVDHTSIANGDPDEWHDVIQTNVLGVIYSTRAVLPHLLRQGRGDIVIVSSASGRVTYVGEPAYVSSKHATVAFGDVLRKEVSPDGIRVTLIEPGLVDTPLVRAHEAEVANTVPSDVVPLRPEDCANAIRFALIQPRGCCINEIVIRPTAQLL